MTDYKDNTDDLIKEVISDTDTEEKDDISDDNDNTKYTENAEISGACSEPEPEEVNILSDKHTSDKIIPETAPYQISYDLYASAYKCYQNRFVFPKNRILQLLLLVLAADFGYHGAVNPDNKIAFFLLALCAALIFVLWYNPRRMRRSVMDVVREVEGDEFVFSMDEEKMTFAAVPSEYIQDVPNDEIPSNPPTEIYFDKNLSVIEKYEFFLICRGKQAFYVLPKYALYDNQAEIIRCHLENKIGKRFRCKI
jgi:hypothetical protein